MNKLKKVYNFVLEQFSRLIRYPLSKPSGSDFVLTYKCNFKCTHCDIHKYRNQKELSTNDWKKIIDRFYNWVGPNYQVTLSGGEVFLR